MIDIFDLLLFYHYYYLNILIYYKWQNETRIKGWMRQEMRRSEMNRQMRKGIEWLKVLVVRILLMYKDLPMRTLDKLFKMQIEKDRFNF